MTGKAEAGTPDDVEAALLRRYGTGPEIFATGTALDLRRVLTRTRTPEEAFRFFLDRYGFPGADRVERRTVSSLLAAGRAAEVFRVHDAAGRRFALRPPRVIGPGDHAVEPMQRSSREVFLTRLDRVLVRSGSSVIDDGGSALLDFQADEMAETRDTIDFDLGLFFLEGGQAWVPQPGDDAPRMEEAFSLLGITAMHFGHWSAEYLPRYAMALELGLPPVPVLINAGMPPSHRAFLERLAPAGTPIVEVDLLSPMRVDRLWAASNLSPAVIFPALDAGTRPEAFASDPAVFAGLATAMADRIEAKAAPAPGPERLYIGRSAGLRHGIENRDEVEALFRANGFTVIYPETLDFAEQFRLARGARRIAGPEGSGMHLAFFARPGAKVLLLNNPYTRLMFLLTGLLEALQLDVTVVTGPVARRNKVFEHLSGYRLDAAALDAFLKDWLPD